MREKQHPVSRSLLHRLLITTITHNWSRKPHLAPTFKELCITVCGCSCSKHPHFSSYMQYSQQHNKVKVKENYCTSYSCPVHVSKPKAIIYPKSKDPPQHPNIHVHALNCQQLCTQICCCQSPALQTHVRVHPGHLGATYQARLTFTCVNLKCHQLALVRRIFVPSHYAIVSRHRKHTSQQVRLFIQNTLVAISGSHAQPQLCTKPAGNVPAPI